MTEKTLYVQKYADGITAIVLNKPQRRNAIDSDMMEHLNELLRKLEKDEDTRVILLKGEGDHFCSGGDLKAGGGKVLTIEESRATLKKYCQVILTIQEMEKPVIAMVKGYAVGGGMSLALACDLIFASDSARFMSNFLRVGIVPEMGTMLFLPQTIGLYRAKELWFTGRVVMAEEAHAMGFVNRVFPEAAIEEETLAFAREISQMPALSLRITKRITNSMVNHMLNTVLEAELQSSPFCAQTEEHKAYKENFKKS